MPRRCGHCGRDGTIEPVGSIAYETEKSELVSPTRIDEFISTWNLQVDRCSICRGLVLSTFGFREEWQDPSENVYHPFYPEAKDVAVLPERVRQRYEEMLELLFAPDAFAMRVKSREVV